MKNKKFLYYSLIYVILVGILIYALKPGNYILNFLGYYIDLPIAIWLLLPLIIFAILANLHILYHSFSFYKYKKDIKKDVKLFNEFAKDILLGIKTEKQFKSKNMLMAVKLIKFLSPWNKYENINFDDDFAQLIKDVENVKKGQICDIKRYKLANENPFNLENEKNKINNLNEYYLEILKSNKSTDLLKQTAIEKLAKNSNYNTIKKFNTEYKNGEIILQRYVDGDLDLKNDEILEILSKYDIKSYNNISLKLKNKLEPQVYINIFKKLSENKPETKEAYLLALYELEILDELRENLSNSEDNEFIEIKAMLFLKDNGKIIPRCLYNDRF